ncbi:hypothetical protein H6768_04845 [Candidatus Peribacteria bacterium]|nr:hypothetical protein [Candidatus Peribacteria bacterium]
MISVRVLTPDLAAVKEFLSKNTIEWTEQKEGLWVKDHSASESSTPGATYEFTRHAQISPSLKLVWEGKHTNPENEGGAFTVNDSLSIRDTRRVYPIPGTCK